MPTPLMLGSRGLDTRGVRRRTRTGACPLRACCIFAAFSQVIEDQDLCDNLGLIWRFFERFHN